jgi:hypothetical protein
MVHCDTEFEKTSAEESTLKIVICQTTGRIISYSNKELYPSIPHTHILVKGVCVVNSSVPFIPPPFIKIFDRKNPIEYIPLTPMKHPLLTNGPEHSHTMCSGNCKKHPLITPIIYNMMYGNTGWGDIVYNEDQKHKHTI